MKVAQWVAAAAVAFGAMTTAQADTIKIAAGEWAPYIGAELPDNGTHAKIVRDVMKAAGHEIELEYMPWNRSLELAKRGKYAATFSWSYTDERGEGFHFPTVPLEEHLDVVFYNKDNHPAGLNITSMEDIKAKGLKAVGLAGYWYESAFEEAGVEMHVVHSAENAWKLLQAGRADVMIENEVAGEAYIKDVLGADGESIGNGGVLRTVAMHILFSKAHPDGEALRDAFDAHAK